jgi:hypothetical protein
MDDYCPENKHYAFTKQFSTNEICMVHYILARDEKEAIKITNDLRARLIAENLWGVDKDKPKIAKWEAPSET